MKFLPILMTASVSTNGMKGACFSDVERYEMYLNTLKFYINKFLISNTCKVPTKLVFVENSGWDLHIFQHDLQVIYGSDIISSEIEFISLPPDNFDISKGKGYNELLMINLVLDKSIYIDKAGIFFKVTGRYPILNLSQFLDTFIKALGQGCKFYCDIKNHNLYKRFGLNWNSHSFDARLWGSTVSFYNENIQNVYILCNDYDGSFVENIIFGRLNDLTRNFTRTKESDIICRFSREARFGGVEGSISSAASFSKDQQSFKSKLKIIVGNFFRIFTPWFKF